MKETRFKQTEIGLIPEDWEVLYLYNISQNAMYGVGASAVKYDGINKYIRITDINDTNGCFEPMPLVSPEWFLDKYIVKENDILIARTGASVGKCYLYKQSDGKLIFAGFLMRLNIINADSKFTFYQLCTKYYKNWIASESARTGQPGVNLQQIKSFGIPSPQSMREQNKIASALTSIDNLLLSIDKLIEKKRLIKQGAMQELLTGKKRLPGFTGEWVELKLGKLCDIFGRIGFRGYTKADLVKEGNGAISFSPSDINSNKINYNTCTYISYSKYEESPEIQVFNGDIIFCKTASIGKCALVENLKEKATINPQFIVMKNFNCDNRYLYYRLIDESFQTKIKKIAGGSTIPTMSQEKLKEETFVMPENVKEQKAISRILANIDKEIESLEGKKAKYEHIKQGMMQQLLTGKIRLIS